MDDFDPEAEAAARPLTPGIDPIDPETANAAVVPLAAAFHDVLAALAAGRVDMGDPLQRTQMVELRETLQGLLQPAKAAVTFIDQIFAETARSLGAKAIPLDDGREVTWEAPQGTYRTDTNALRQDLLELAVKGFISRDAVDECVPQVVSVEANHVKLNSIAKRLGGPVAEAINARRIRVPATGPGRVRYPGGA